METKHVQYLRDLSSGHAKFDAHKIWNAATALEMAQRELVTLHKELPMANEHTDPSGNCTNCGHSIDLHVTNVRGKVRCVHANRLSTKTPGIPLTEVCECTDYVFAGAPATPRSASAEGKVPRIT